MVYKYPKKIKQFTGQIYVLVKEYKWNEKEKAQRRVKALHKQGYRARMKKVTRGYTEYYAVYKRDLTTGKTEMRRGAQKRSGWKAFK